MDKKAIADKLAYRLYDFANGLLYRCPPTTDEEADDIIKAIASAAGGIARDANAVLLDQQRP